MFQAACALNCAHLRLQCIGNSSLEPLCQIRHTTTPSRIELLEAMDEHNVHQFWGGSPFMDLVDAHEALTIADSRSTATCSRASTTAGATAQEASQVSELRALQVCSYDARHTLATLSRISRHPAVASLSLYVYEEEPEVLARHMLLLHVLLDGSLTARERVETLLELHGNALLRDKTAAYLDTASRVLEDIVAAQGACASGQQQQEGGLARLFDLSQLLFQERDALAEAFQKYRLTVQYDMVKAWEARCRRWYADRYDARRNMIDWDYHMRLAPRGTPGADPTHGSITHFYHFRHWRLHGIAHELRGATYSAPNRSLLSTAIGRTKEFKDRSGKDVGRGVSAWGFWGDVLNGAFQAFGTMSEDLRLLKVVNKQFAHTSIDVAEHNIQAFLHELRTGQRWSDTHSSTQGEAHRAPAARGPTSAENLEQQQQEKEELEQHNQPNQQEQLQEEVASSSNGAEASSTAAEAKLAALSITQHTDGSAGAAASGQAGACSTSDADDAAASDAAKAVSSAQATPGKSNPSADSAGQAGVMQQQQDALKAAEAALDSAAWQRLTCARIVLLCGDAGRAFGGQRGKKLAGSFQMATLGARHVHLAGAGHGLAQLLVPGGLLLVESGKYMVQLNEKQLGAFGAKVGEIAQEGDFEGGSGADAAAAPDGYLVFRAKDASTKAHS